MTQLSDEELYSELSKTPNSAFKILYERHSGPLFRFIYRFAGNRQLTEEILQDVFVQALEGKFQNGEGANLKAWLYTLAKNKSLNHLKKSSHELKNELAAGQFTDLEDGDNLSITTDLLKKLKYAESALPLDLSEPWQLRKQGLSNQEIANQLSIPVGTVKSRFFRLVEHLKQEFNL